MEAATAVMFHESSVTGERTVRWRNVIIHEIAEAVDTIRQVRQNLAHGCFRLVQYGVHRLSQHVRAKACADALDCGCPDFQARQLVVTRGRTWS